MKIEKDIDVRDIRDRLVKNVNDTYSAGKSSKVAMTLRDADNLISVLDKLLEDIGEEY